MVHRSAPSRFRTALVYGQRFRPIIKLSTQRSVSVRTRSQDDAVANLLANKDAVANLLADVISTVRGILCERMVCRCNPEPRL